MRAYAGIEHLLTEDEVIKREITTKRLKEIITKADIVSANIGRNTHGEFLFITVKFGEYTCDIWGLGYHETNNQYLINTWHYHRNPIDIWGVDLTPMN